MPPDEDPDDAANFGTPLPPEDRLWRHPAEMIGQGQQPQIILVSKSSGSLVRTMLIAVLAGVIGAGTTLAVVLATDAFVRERPGAVSKEIREITPPRDPSPTDLTTAENLLPSVARVEASGPDGVVNSTAVMFRSDGQLITTADAVDGPVTLTLYLYDGTKVENKDIKLVGRSVDADVAVLQIPRTDLPVAVGTRRKVTFGDQTVMIDASPQTRGPVITVGVVTKEVAEVNRQDRPTVYGVVQTTTRASVSPRSAGTVFIDSAGTVIGLVSSRAESPQPGDIHSDTSDTTPGDDGRTLHYAIPADWAWDVAGQIADNSSHRAVKPWIGLPRGDDLSREEASQLDISGGMRITFIEDNSPAVAAYLRINDVIVAVEDDNVRGYNEFVAALRRHHPGEQLVITYMRNGSIEKGILTVSGVPELP
jgi:putative serine protease PepD